MYIGEMVNFVLGDDSQMPGEIRPAIIVRIFDADCINLQVFTDGENDYPDTWHGGLEWKTSVVYSPDYRPGTWFYRDDPQTEGVAIPVAAIASLVSYAGDEPAAAKREVMAWLANQTPPIRFED